MRKKKNQPSDGLVAPGAAPTLRIQLRSDEKKGKTLARMTLDPVARNAGLGIEFGSKILGDQMRPELSESMAVLEDTIERTECGDMTLASRIHTAQAISLDTLFTELVRRSGNNLGQYPAAAETYMRLALKAQAACRATLESLARLHQPREQIVKHVHISDGGQAVVADHFHHHTGGTKNAETVKQSHATRTAGECASLPCHDAKGNGVPISIGERETALQDARRDEPRGT